MALDEYFSTGPPFERPVFDAVMARLADVGPVHIEPVSVGIFLKRDSGEGGAGKFAELRPMTRWVSLALALPRPVVHPRFTAKAYPSGDRVHQRLRLEGPDAVDDLVGEWLAEAYFAAPE